MRSEINDRLCYVAVAKASAIDGLAHRRFEARLAFSVLPKQRGANVLLEAFVPETVEPLLAKYFERFVELFPDDEKPFISAASRSLSREFLTPRFSCQVLVFLDEVPIVDVLHAVHADAVNMEIVDPSQETGLH